MKKTIIVFICVIALAAACVIPCFAAELAADDESVPDDALISYSYYENVLKPKLIAEIREQILSELGDGSDSALEPSLYSDVKYSAKTLIKLGDGCEMFFRGGYAVVITADNVNGSGITDLSDGQTLFAGNMLQSGHVYVREDAGSDVYVLVTGDSVFTFRGSYEIC